MPVTMSVTRVEKGGSGNASTTASASTKTGFLQSISKDSPYYEDAQKLLEDRRAKEESDKQKKGQRNAKYFSENIQPFVKTYDYVTGYIGNGIGNWSDQHKVNDYIGMYDSLSENYKKLQDAFVDNDYLRDSMSEEDYKKTSEAMDAIGKALEDGASYVRQAGEVYGQFGNADEYNRHVQLSGMSADNLQKMVDSLDAERDAKKQGMATLTSSREQKKALDQLEEERPAYEAERVLLTSYLNNAKYNEGVKKYGVDPKNMTYSEIMGIVDSQAAYRRNPDVYDFVRSFYDSQNENYWHGKKAEEFVDGLDAHERYLYKTVSDLLGTNGSAGVSVSGAAPARVSNTAKVNELTKEISERTGESEDVVKQNIQMAQWVFDAQNRAEQQEKISEYVSANAGNAALANAGSVLINLPAGVAAFLDQTGQTIGNKLNGTDAPVNPNTPGQSLLNVSNDIRDATRKQIEKKVSAKLPTGANLGVFAYDTLMNTADVVAQTLVGGIVGRGIGSALGLGAKGINKAISATTGMIASSTAAANTVQESLEDGYSNGMAVARGAIAGAIENIVEAVQIDRLLNGLAGGDSAIKAVLKGALSEGTEEVVTNILTEDLVEFFFGNGTRISRLTAEYESAGYSKEGALRKAALDVIGQDAETFVSAAITGAVFGGTEAAATRANDKANTKLAQDGINNRIGGIGEIEFLKAVNGEMALAAEEFNRTHNDAQFKEVGDEVLRRIAYIQSVKEDIQKNSSLRNVIGESGIQQEIQKLDANVQTLSEIRSLIESGRYDPSYQAELILAKEEDLTKSTEEQAKSQRNVLKAAQMYLSAFGSEKKAVEAAKKTAAQENARAAELSAERNRLTQALSTADETQKVEINRRLQEIGKEIKRTARNVIRAGKVEKALGDQYRSAINSALGGNEKELSKRLTNALGREVKVAYDDNANGFSSMKTGADSSTLTVNPELILRTENALRQEFGEEYTGNLAKEKLVHEIAHAAARSDANFDAKVLEIYHLLRDNGLITDDDIDEAATREAYKDTLKRYMATEPAKAEVRRLVEAGNAEADAIAAVENAYIGEELVAQTLEWMERATNGQLSREILGEKRNVFVQALNRIAEIFRSVAAKLKGVDNVNAAKTAGFADKIERFAREFAERGVAEMNEGKAAVSQESAGATQSADNAQGNSGEGAVASGESEATTGTQEEDERQSLDVRTVEAVKNSKPVSGEDEVRYSIEFNEKMMDAARRANNGAVTKRIMDKAESDRAAVKRLFTDPKTSDSLGLPPDIIGKTYIPNSSYSGTEENTTVCPRSLAADALMDAVAESIGRPLTVEDTLAISQEYWKYTDTPECLYCYVAMDRKAYREFLGSYLKQRDDVLADIASGMDKEAAYSKFLDGRKPTANMRKRFDMWVRNAEKGADLISTADLASDDAMQKAAARGKSVRDQINDARKYAQSASWAKKRIGYAAYDGHILRWKKNRIDSLNSHYGLRMYSFSDFSPAFILENMQMITDAAVRKLKMLAYTKDLNFVKIFAKTGMNINVSVFAHEGKNGVMAQDGMQGADWTEARNLRDEYGNVGITFVATNDGQVDWALAQDWIDVVIPFHLVRTGAKVADSFGWKNYTAMSSDVKTKAWTSENAASVYPTEHQNNKEKYFEALRKNNLEPRFAQWAENPNYMKLVNETRQSAAETSPVQPVFDLGAAEDAIEEMRKRGGYYVPIGGSEEVMREIADEIASGIDGDERHSLEVGGRYDYSKPFSEQIDDYIAGRIPKYDTLVVGGTPDVFKEIGLLSLPMTYDTNHLDEVIQGKKRDHTFGVENLKKIPGALENPIAIFASNSHPESSVVAILDLSYDSKNMFAAVEIDGFAQSNGNRINSNKLSSVYTRENAVRLLKDSVEKHKSGDVSLFYIDTKKASDFLDASEVDFLGGTSITDGFVHSIHDPGSPVNTRLKNVTYSQQFRKWFGEWRRVPEKASKVVNRDGTPRIVYHYTDGDFTVFDSSMSGNNQGKSHGDGIYVSTNPNEFSYAGKNKMELYANIRNPFEMQLTGKQADYVLDKYASANHDLDGNDGMYRAHAKSKLMTPSRVFDYLNQYADENGIKTSDILKDLGFDGVHDGSEWVAFDSNQLKSATDNIGLFDANNEDIRYSLSDEQRMKRQAENIAFLKKRIQRGRSYAVSPSALDKVWSELRRVYGIDKADEQTVRDMFKIVDDMSMHKMEADEGMARLNAMAREVLTNVYPVDDRLMRENEAFIQYIRSTPLSVPADNESDLGGKYGDYRNENRRYVNLSREGTPVDSVYEQICDMFPGILDRSLKNPVEQIHEIVDAMRSMDPDETPVYSEFIDSAAESFVSSVMAKMDRYSRETFRSKSERDKEILRENAERQAAAERNRLDVLRAREAEEYEKRVKRMETQNRNTVNAYEARIQGIEMAAARDAVQYREIINNLQNRMDELGAKNDRRDYSDALRRDARVIRSAAVSPNQKRYIPEEHRKTIERIADFLDKVSRYNGTYRMDMADMAVYKDIQSLAPLYGEDFADTAAYLVNEIDWTAGADMAEDRVAPMVALRVANSAYKLGRLLRTSIARQNRMVLDGKNRNANYISGELIDSLNNRRNVEKEFNTLETDEKGKILSSSDSGKILQRMEKSTRKTRKWISLNTMDGYSFLRRMGKVGDALYNTLRAAQSEQIMHVQEYVKTLQDKLLKDQKDGEKGVDLSRYIGDKQKTVTVTLSNGEKYTMTAAQAMTIVTLYEREAGKSHIENGGVRLVHPKDKTLSAAVALKAEDVAAIAQNLDEDDRRVMKVMNDFIREQCTEWGNEATLERYGFYRFNTQHYFPITVDRNALPSNVSAESAKDYLQFNVQNVGFAKAADASAKAPVVIDSFISVINRHVEGMATYAAYLNAEDIVNRLMSAPGVKDAMQRSLGTGAVKYMTDMMTELKQGNRGGSEDALTQWWNKSAGHYKSAAVSYNLSTALKQPISIIRAAAVLDPKYILAAKRVPRSGTGKAAHEEMMQYSGIGVKKSVGYSDVGISRDINAQIGYEKKDLSKKVRNVSEFGMALAGYMDEITWDSIWIACREEVRDKKPDLTANHEAFMNEVAKRFAEVVAQTQVVDSPLDSSPLSRSKSPLARNVFAFTSEPIKGFNLLMNAMDDLINAEKGSIRQKQAAAQMARTAVITLVGWAAEASISAAFQMIRDEDDDEGELVKEFGVKFGKQMISNAYNVVPYIGQLVDIVVDAWKGYDFTDMGIAPLVDVIDSAKSVMDTLRNPENKSETLVKAGRDFVESVATFFGIPIRNFNRAVVAGLRLFFHSTNLYTAEYEMQKIFYNPKSSTAREKHEFNSLLTDAYLSGNKKAFEYIYNDMRSMGLSPQTIMNGIAKDAYAQDITSTGSTLTRYTPGSDAWYIGMKGIFDRDLSAPDGLEKELTRLYKATEEKGVLPKYKSDSYTVDGESKKLSVKDHEKALAEYSKLYYEIATILRNSPAYKNADDTLKAYWMAQAERYAGAISIYRVDSEYNLRTKWWEKMKDKPYYDVAGYIIKNLKPSKEDE